MEDLHYRFRRPAPYRLNRCLFALKSDREFLARYLTDRARRRGDGPRRRRGA